MTQAPLAWVHEVHSTLIDTKAIPLSGFVPPFPWDPFSQIIGEMLQLGGLKITAKHSHFLKETEISSGFGMDHLVLALELTPLTGQIFWIIGKEEIAKLTTLALSNSPANKGFSSPEYQEGFYHYLAMHVLAELGALHPFDDLTLKMGKFTHLPSEECLCVDIEMQHPKCTFWGRLVVPASVHHLIKNHFSKAHQASFESSRAQQLELILRLQVGQTTLALSQFTNVRVGDFILLDRCTFDPKTHKGTATLLLEETPLLRVRIKENHVKIVDYAVCREENNPMPNKEFPDEENPAEELSSVEFETQENAAEDHLWSSETESVEKIISSQEIPLSVSVEVARLKMTLEKLLQLSPGNVLELPVRPEQGVDLVIGGKKVAKAELIKMGEMLGVKILQLGE